ncbi:MAG: potassium transporter TrkG [Candidatus Anstonellales archaeon]
MIAKISESFLVISIIISISTIYSYLNNLPNFNNLLITNIITLAFPILYTLSRAYNSISLFISRLISRDRLVFKDPKRIFRVSQGNFLAFIAIIWLMFGVIASIPFYLKTGKIVDSLFESFSAITTSGFSVIGDELEDDLLIYRALLQWIGGLGVTSFIFTVLRGISGKYLANNIGIEQNYVDSFRSILIIYLTFTLVIIILLIITGLDYLNAFLLSLTTTSNGGFPAKSNDLNLIQKYIMGLGMLAMSISLPIYLGRGDLKLVGMYIVYLIMVIILSHVTGMESNDAILFTLTTSTSGGYSYVSPNLNNLQIMIFSIVMLIGGMTISTAGGIKINRIFEVMKTIRYYVYSKLYGAKFKIVNEPVLILILFANLYISTFIAHLIEGFDIRESIFNSASVVGNCGYSFLDYRNTSDIFKLYIIIVMYLARIEVIPIIVLGFKLLNR